jgi:hypothetical protein
MALSGLKDTDSTPLRCLVTVVTTVLRARFQTCAIVSFVAAVATSLPSGLNTTSARRLTAVLFSE